MKLRPTPISGTWRIRKRRVQRAFTFAEVLAALLFMAIVIPVAMHGLQIANRAGVLAQRKGIAVQMADQVLNELAATGHWLDAGQKGTLDSEWKDYSYRTFNEAWSEDAMLRLVSVEVAYLVQNQEYYVRLSTLMRNTN